MNIWVNIMCVINIFRPSFKHFFPLARFLLAGTITVKYRRKFGSLNTPWPRGITDRHFSVAHSVGGAAVLCHNIKVPASAVITK